MKNKIYIAFDADNDMQYYNLLKAWDANDGIFFEFTKNQNAHNINYAHDWALPESIKNQLRARLKESRILLLLVGASTYRCSKFVEYEVEAAMRMDIPIVYVMLNSSFVEPKWVPMDYPLLTIDFNAKSINKSLREWEIIHMYYKDSNCNRHLRW